MAGMPKTRAVRAEKALAAMTEAYQSLKEERGLTRLTDASLSKGIARSTTEHECPNCHARFELEVRLNVAQMISAAKAADREEDLELPSEFDES